LAISRSSVGFERHVDELGAQRFDLLFHRGPHVGGLDHRTQALAGGDRLKPRHAGSQDHHARRLDRAGRGHHHRHQPLIRVGRQ